jgi:hypothetical protein
MQIITYGLSTADIVSVIEREKNQRLLEPVRSSHSQSVLTAPPARWLVPGGLGGK